MENVNPLIFPHFPLYVSSTYLTAKPLKKLLLRAIKKKQAEASLMNQRLPSPPFQFIMNWKENNNDNAV